MKRTSTLLGGAVLGVAILAACGGGGSGASAPGGPVPVGATPVPVTIVPTSSFSASNAAAIPQPGTTAAALALASDAGGASANLAIPPGSIVPTDATVAALYSSSGDASLPALSVNRSTASVRATRSDDGAKSSIAFLRLQFSADVSLPQAPAFTFVVPGTLPTANVNYFLALIDPLRAAAGWQLGFEGPATVTAATTSSGKPGTQLAFASNLKPITFAANQTYYLVVYAVAASAASPTPVPSTVPTNPPHDGKPGAVSATPPNVQFPAVTSSPVAVTFAQPGFTGPFTLHGDCTGIVNTGGSSPTWTITPVGQGRCVLVGLGDRGASAVVHIGVVTGFETPHPSISPTAEPSRSPEPGHSASPEPSHSPEPVHSASPEPSHSPEPVHSASPEPSHSPEPVHSASPEPTRSPEPGVSPTPAPTATPRTNV